MALSKSTRISIMLAIDTVFFLVEMISGLMVHSLALTADAFHMLNDIISLAVGLWAVRISKRQSTDKFSYGVCDSPSLDGPAPYLHGTSPKLTFGFLAVGSS
jgi:Co/Zn/Cd efflux system component